MTTTVQLTSLRVILMALLQALCLLISFLAGQQQAKLRAERQAAEEMQQFLRDRDRGVRDFQKSVRNWGKELDAWRLNK
jgi:hypothetical protein